MLDVCLCLEEERTARGADPDLAAELVEGLAGLRFGLVRVGRDMPREPRRAAPPNVDRIVEAAIGPGGGPPPEGSPLASRLRSLGRTVAFWRAAARRAALARIEPLARGLASPAAPLGGLDGALDAAAGRTIERLSIDEALSTPEAFDLAARIYETEAPPGTPFAPFHRAHREALRTVLRAVRVNAPPAAVYHATSTGLAALVAAAAAARAGAPLVIGDEPPEPGDPGSHSPELRLARRLAYERAAAIVVPYEGARRRAIAAGAPEARVAVIPRGVDADRFAGLRAHGKRIEEKEGVVVALVAPIVPSKDVKTFLRAAKLLVERLDLVEIVVVGAVDEDEAYYRECVLQAQMLGVDRVIRFLGPLALEELFPHLDCLLLTSVREGLSRPLLHAMAAGVPCVATDAGATRELLEGSAPEDRALGPAGIVCPVADHEAIAAAVARLARDRDLWRRCAAAGAARVDRYYRRERAHEAYRALYERVREP